MGASSSSSSLLVYGLGGRGHSLVSREEWSGEGLGHRTPHFPRLGDVAKYCDSICAAVNVTTTCIALLPDSAGFRVPGMHLQYRHIMFAQVCFMNIGYMHLFLLPASLLPTLLFLQPLPPLNRRGESQYNDLGMVDKLTKVSAHFSPCLWSSG